ncbi:MAG: dual specificity protein phosphatase family protein [Burkholderiales bacterium]|nr:dual specificity protein phosphatase family protein [Burkholderiales bacterium]
MALAANSTGAETVTTATKSTAVPRPASWANQVAVSGNLYRVTPLLYRSARLQTGDVTLLQSLGIKTVVSLRAFHSDSQLLAGSGIRLQRIGIHTWDIDDREVILALRAITAGMKQGPVLLHCLHGADRTGLITAMYRMLYQGWSKEQALDELVNGGYGYHSMWKNIPVYIRQVDLEKIRTEVEKP